jgi:hypothetical protein
MSAAAPAPGAVRGLNAPAATRLAAVFSPTAAVLSPGGSGRPARAARSEVTARWLATMSHW